MMSRSALRTLVTAIGLLAVFLIPRGTAHAAFSACACHCIDTEVIEKGYVAPQTDCRAACVANPGVHQASQLKNAYHQTVQKADQCVCEWSAPTVSLKWTSLTSGRSTCAGDCAAVCDGAANVDPAQNQTTNKISVDCFRDDQCATGPFSIYAQRNNCDTSDPNCGAPRCDFQAIDQLTDPTDYATFAPADHVMPRCIIPATAGNADIECQTYGGKALGGVCRRFDTGENLAQYIITRPYVSGGSYHTEDFDTTTFNLTVAALNARLANETPPGPGLCELYGEATDVTIGSQAVNTNPYTKQVVGITFGSAKPPASAQPLQVNASKRYLCAVKKINTCGTVKPLSGMTIQTSNAYTCVDPIRVGLTNTSAYCFPLAQSQNSLCVNSPGTQCCAEAGGGCYSDSDCIVPKKCIKANASDKFGACKYVTVCDDDHADRRCRSATLTERANPSICSKELVPGTSRCGTGTMACCGAPATGLASGCALDLLNQPVIGQSTQYYTATDLTPFMCVKLSNVKATAPTQFRQNGNDTELIPFTSGGGCLTNNDPAGLKSGAARVMRCGSADQVCCNLSVIGESAALDQALNRPGNGASCGNDPANSFSCAAAPTYSEADLNAQGFSSQWAFLYALASSPYCKMTPISISSYTDTKECASNSICCKTDIAFGHWCSSDADCGNNTMVCDPSIHQCVPIGDAKKTASQNCVEAARQKGETNTDAIAAPGTESSFSCQLVSSANDAENRTLCLQRGCETENANGSIPDGSSYRCCAPGTGVAPSAAGAAQSAPSSTQISVNRAPGSLQLSQCIASGDCTLDDIVASGAAFANFLIAISGSAYLIIFVYAGALYLTAGSSNRVDQAKKTLKQATIGIVLLLGAYVFIRSIQQTFIGNSLNATQKETTCGTTTQTKEFQCQYLNVDPKDSKALKAAISAGKCVQHMCPDSAAPNYVCCPTNTVPNP